MVSNPSYFTIQQQWDKFRGKGNSSLSFPLQRENFGYRDLVGHFIYFESHSASVYLTKLLHSFLSLNSNSV